MKESTGPGLTTGSNEMSYMNNDLKRFEAWFVTGSQHLYGEETLQQVATHAQVIAGALDGVAPVGSYGNPSSKPPRKFTTS